MNRTLLFALVLIAATFVSTTDAAPQRGAANHILDNLIAQRKAVPMIVVTPLGYGTSTGPAGGCTLDNITGYSKSFSKK